MMMFSNKKAEGERNVGNIILVALLLLIIAYLIWFFFIKNFAEKTLADCRKEYCKDSCDFATEFRDGTKICRNNEKKVCCKPINPSTNPISPECKDKQPGDSCQGSQYKVCTTDLAC